MLSGVSHFQGLLGQHRGGGLLDALHRAGLGIEAAVGQRRLARGSGLRRASTGQVHVPNDYGSISFEVAELQFPVYDRLDLFLEALEKF